MSQDATSSLGAAFLNDVKIICDWIRNHDGDKPRRKSDDPVERRVAALLAHLQLRCGKPRVAGSTKPKDQQLSVEEEARLRDELAAACAIKCAPPSETPPSVGVDCPATDASAPSQKPEPDRADAAIGAGAVIGSGGAGRKRLRGKQAPPQDMKVRGVYAEGPAGRSVEEDCVHV